ncbi:uncharacterized protein STEHIDRAFT_113776 [Stereum hirsutum FP-91666 SS1]|uniref:uncharacterized protein n=1 Tax=Stereum hirsutum (strain FP-91666) TaxID=721885 RepID=UPI0004449BF4|nr:uncharacterized protein STEHIDRAFT_113776 [Stereum hirsutum FP-91666 SS1]EIM82647.1 hypothetical protein STEHIDRAFT_113776 [Stereum hirsutum FP-91666 SS1]
MTVVSIKHQNAMDRLNLPSFLPSSRVLRSALRLGETKPMDRWRQVSLITTPSTPWCCRGRGRKRMVGQVMTNPERVTKMTVAEPLASTGPDRVVLRALSPFLTDPLPLLTKQSALLCKTIFVGAWCTRVGNSVTTGYHSAVDFLRSKTSRGTNFVQHGRPLSDQESDSEHNLVAHWTEPGKTVSPLV